MKYIISKLVFKIKFMTVLFFGLLIGFVEFPAFDSIFIGEAEAVVGRPATPRSAAGVARRTTRRTVRRRIAIGTRVMVLPAGCTSVITRDVIYYHCGGVYYEPYYEGTTVVYIVVEEP
jgi:hypothetical protein